MMAKSSAISNTLSLLAGQCVYPSCVKTQPDASLKLQYNLYYLVRDVFFVHGVGQYVAHRIKIRCTRDR